MRFDAKIFYGLDSGVPLPGEGAGGFGGGGRRNAKKSRACTSLFFICHDVLSMKREVIHTAVNKIFK